MCNNGGMTLRRKILLGLLVPAVVMVVAQMIRPEDGLELLCIVFALPVAVVNAWEWTSQDASERENLRVGYPRDFHPLKVLREWWLALEASLRRSLPYKGAEEKASLVGAPEMEKEALTGEPELEKAAPTGEPELEEAAPANEPEIRKKIIPIRALGILLIAAGALIMADVFLRTGFGMGILIAGMLGFIAFTGGLYLTFG